MTRAFLIIAVVACLGLSARGQKLDDVWEGEIQDPKRPVVINLDFKALRISFSGTAPTNITQSLRVAT